jgi:predicted Zn-dependent protease
MPLDSIMRGIGKSSYQSTISEAKVEKEGADHEMLVKVGKKISKVAAQPEYDWKYSLIDDEKTVNAWCMPGGKMAVYTGLIERLNATDDELAAVMGHEIAHALREHARERIGRQMATQTASTIGSIALQIFTGVQIDPQLAGSVIGAATVLPNSRENESEADVIGVELMARAGYDPRASLSLWRKMGQVAGGGGGPEFLSTHPSGETRLRELQGYVDKVMPLYQAAKR